jgi:hypothetical protein
MVVTTTQQPTASVAGEVLRSWLDYYATHLLVTCFLQLIDYSLFLLLDYFRLARAADIQDQK